MRNGTFVEEAAGESLPERLCLARQRQDYSRADLSNLIGVTEGTITRWEQGRSAPRSNRMAILAGALGVSMRWLLSGQGDMSQPADPANTKPDRDDLLRELTGIAREVDLSLQALSRIETRLGAMVRNAQPRPDRSQRPGWSSSR
ncbi:helix-turn-helix domain-containing protein [Ovoidimarina sediminis]|uniref:helix-turn-helix domain-containing protein n=1 Tax=Ovoidimarina sediminis TaxID=3079856 RepID=UPI002912CDCD|nr:helix-turn-helix domain-containing protein [Rhodophyticola sp. MJ-SS7]MDU8941869.1 helix-turn-helix domain-containing protein [Rhodophyticola sp. MJ-SS7]